MGALASSTCENAPSGTCPPLGNAADAAFVPLKAVLDALAPDDDPVRMLVAALAPEFVGPRERPVVDDPPETSPDAPLEDVAPVRMYRSRRSIGFRWNPGISSKTT